MQQKKKTTEDVVDIEEHLHWSLQHKNSHAQHLWGSSSPIGTSFQGFSPNLFVGRFGYPHIRVGMLSTPHYQEHDSPQTWVKQGYSINTITALRHELINGTFSAHVKHDHSSFLASAQLVAQAHKPVDIDVSFTKQPHFSFTTPKMAIPFGPSVDLSAVDITDHVRIERPIDKVVSDTDLKAQDALVSLQDSSISEHSMTKLLSAGTLGVDRKLVPTRWAITAVDDTLGKRLRHEVQTNNIVDGVRVLVGGYFGNYFVVVIWPGSFCYELFEMYFTSSSYTTDAEDVMGRTSYVKETAGGYYAARLAILEYMHKEQIQGCALALRVINDEYHTPLGVWVVREAVRDAMNHCMHFESKELALTFAKQYFKKKLNYDVSPMIAKSKLLSMRQRSLNEFS